jgi:two-component system sensor histidine kinase KdpD
MQRINEFVIAAVSIALVTGIAFALAPFTGYQAIALLYLLVVVAVGLKLSREIALTVAATSALLWNVLFVSPRYTFYIENFQDGMMFAMFFVVALAMGHLTSRLRQTEVAERHRERRTAALYELAHQAAFATDLTTGLRGAVTLIESIVGAKAALFIRQNDHTLSNVPHGASSLRLAAKELDVAEWVFSHRRPAGKMTQTLPDSEALHLPLQGRTAIMGVLSVCPPATRLFDSGERELLDAFAVLIGLALEKDHIVEALKRAEIIESSDRLRRALLESVSHELKTPLSAVQAGIDALARQGGRKETESETLREVRLAVRRLHRVINNLLDMTRIEAGVIQPKLDWCDPGELIQAAVDVAGDSLSEYQILTDMRDDLPLVKVDQALLEQCVCNLLLNSAAWSAPGTKITVSAAMDGDKFILRVIDEGKGINPAELGRIFDSFYRSANARPGGAGLGLAIVEGFVRAHGGSVRAANREPQGAEFVIMIPTETLQPSALENFG